MIRLLLILLGLAGLMSACAPSTPTAAPTRAPASGETAPRDTRQQTEDLSLVGATGRPQFLNSFANW